MATPITRSLSLLWALALGLLLALDPSQAHAAHLDKVLKEHVKHPTGEMVDVIVLTRGKPEERDKALIRSVGGDAGPAYSSFLGFPARVPASSLEKMRRSPRFKSISTDATVQPLWDRNLATPSVGVPEVLSVYGATGAGVGVAVIDSGAYYHDDLWDQISEWAEFYEDRKGYPAIRTNSFSYDTYGHGTHVAGILAGSGKVLPQFRGIAPGARLVVLKVLGSDGTAPLSRVLRALDWLRLHAAEHNVRVLNLSLGHPVYESYASDPLCVAVNALVSSGITVVASAGNYGRLPDGTPVYGSIVSPGHSPYVITVGAMNPMGTPERGDDIMATFSSKGPTLFDGLVKPDVVAPGVYTMSLLAPATYFDSNFPELRVNSQTYGVPRGKDDYYILSGTSMSAPVVSGIVALMLEKNPALTPNLVKAILQFTAEDRGYDVMTQGAGYVNAVGAVEAATKITATPGGFAPGDYWLNAPLSGESTIAGHGVIWGVRVIWGYGVLWGGAGAIGYNFDALWGQGVLWGGGVYAFDLTLLGDSGVTSQGVLWGGTNLLPQGLIWTGIQMQDLLLGESWSGSGAP
jgi:serine protease AprX